MGIERREGMLLALVLFMGLASRCGRLDQPIVENDVGRQVPTAMVARNLDRGSGFHRPQLDTGPFPNLFLVEPPVYQGLVVGLHRLSGLALEPSGRLVSALAVTAGAFGLWRLARPRAGPAAALIAAFSLSLLPVVLRYGRAVQPDALAMGLTLAGLAAWDESGRRGSGRWGWLLLAWGLLATGLSAKVLYGFVLVPLVAGVIRPDRRRLEAFLALSTLAPAIVWYGYALTMLGEGSRASGQNAAIWGDVLTGGHQSLGPDAVMEQARRVLRAFSPGMVGLVAAWLGWRVVSRGSRSSLAEGRIWVWWAGSLGMALIVLAAKLHHGYYWLMAAPLASVGIARAVVDFGARLPYGRVVMSMVGTIAGVLAVWQAWPTWSTPAEWSTLSTAGPAVSAIVPADGLLVASEALLYFADRRGCRLEWSAAARRRAASEWGARIGGDEPLELVEAYRRLGATHLAELSARLERTPGLRDRLLERYSVAVDRPEVLVVSLAPKEGLR